MSKETGQGMLNSCDTAIRISDVIKRAMGMQNVKIVILIIKNTVERTTGCPKKKVSIKKFQF